MANPWHAIDKLAAKHRADLARAERAVKEAKATSLKVLETGIWKCRFRPFKSEPRDVRAHSSDELVEKLGTLAQERAAAREAAAKAREEERRERRKAVGAAREELKALGVTRTKREMVGTVATPLGVAKRYAWTCQHRPSRAESVVPVLFREESIEALLAAVRKHREVQ